MLDIGLRWPPRLRPATEASAPSPPTTRGRCWSAATPGPAAPRHWPLRLESLAAARGPPRARTRARPLAGRPRPAARSRRDRCSTVPTRSSGSRTYEEAAEDLLREYSTEAGLDPFFTTVAPADRLAILLDRLDDLPLRRHEIRGNPAGLLARLLRRIDLLKTEAVTPACAARLGGRRERAATTAAERERAEREIEFADLYARHDRILREAGSLDGGDLVLELGKLLANRADVAARGRRALSSTCSPTSSRMPAPPTAPCSRRVGAHGTSPAPAIPPRRRAGSGARARRRSKRSSPPTRMRPEIDLGGSLRAPGVTRFWRCENDRAQAQAVAREIEHLLAAGEVRAERICVIAGSGWREGRLVAAALEERSVPFRFAGDAAFFQRPEVRDVLAWLRMLADPGDAAAVVRGLTRPPAELRSVDLAKVTTIARRRKLDMISALEAALESPQLPPEARDRIQTFLRLHRAASNALEGMRADVFVRRLIERVGLRRHRLFAASPETAERLVNLSQLAELAADWSRREPRGSVRDFVRHLSAVAEPAVTSRATTPTRRSPGAVMVAEPAQVKGLEFDHVYLLGLRSGAVARALGGHLDPRAAARRAAAGARRRAHRRASLMLAHVAITRARRRWSISWPDRPEQGRTRPRASTRRPRRRTAPRRRSTRRSCSDRRRACTPPTGCFATRCSRRRGRRARRSRRCGSTPLTTSTGRSPATSS